MRNVNTICQRASKFIFKAKIKAGKLCIPKLIHRLLRRTDFAFVKEYVKSKVILTSPGVANLYEKQLYFRTGCDCEWE